MEISGKYYILSIVIIVSIAIFAVLVALNIGGLGTSLAGFGGPIAAGLYEIVAFLPRWILSGGWPTMIAGICIALAVVIASGYIFEEKHIIATVTGKNQQAGGGIYQDSPSQTIPVQGLQDAPSTSQE